jgi:hypothetical protein
LPLHLNWEKSTLQIYKKGIMTMHNDK